MERDVLRHELEAHEPSGLVGLATVDSKVKASAEAGQREDRQQQGAQVHPAR